MRKNVASQNVAGQVNSRADGSPLTADASVFVTIDGGTQTAGSGTLTHEGNGHWNYVPTQAETNGNHLAFTFVHASGVNQTINVYTVSYDPHNTTTLGLTNLDAAISSRMATYTQPTGFLAATFPSTVASTTNITAGTITTVTNLTNLPAITSNWLTAAGIAAGALNGKGDWNIGKTGYTLVSGPLDAAGTRSAIGLASANLDTQLGTLLTSASYTAPDNAGITAIKAKTDSLTFTIAGNVDTNIQYVNDVQVQGTGQTGNEWRPV